MSNFVNWFNQEIENRGWTYADVAKRGGISKSMISRVVSGQSQPGIEFCKAVATAFDVSDEEVFRRAGILDPLPPAVVEEKEILRIIRSLPTQARASALAMLRGLIESSSSTSVPSSLDQLSSSRLNMEILKEIDQLSACHQEEILRLVERLVAKQQQQGQCPSTE
jgi:transcriptional regulator with XRE-family HTH domain